jgi:DNA repair exonuclease SbcCD ATPase subunit
MKIVALVSENFKRLNSSLVMDGKSVTVEGKNGVGKSSFIDAIWIALTGKDIPEEPIKKGEDSAKIGLTIKSDDGSQFIVERKFTKSGGTLTVRTEDSANFKSPQKFLDDRIGKISFDPFEFVNMQPREQKKFLMELLGIDLNEIDSKKKILLSEKEGITKQYTNLVEELKKLPAITEELKEISAKEVIDKFNKANKARDNVKENQSRIDYLIKTGNEISKNIADLNIRLKNINEEMDERLQENLEIPEIADLETEIQKINLHNEIVKQQAVTKSKHKNLQELIEKGKNKAAELKEIEEKRLKLISSAKMPIDGLSFSEDGLTFEGLPFTEEQLSTAKLIETGIKISIALNPALRIMRIKDGSLLDNETLEIIKKSAKDSDYQLFIEKVSDSKEIGFIIEE